MARKSSKTAHVLNLLSGHDNKKEETAEIQDTEAQNTDSQAAEAPKSESQTPAPANTPAVSIIDHSESDPVAELIQDNLLEELEHAEHAASETSSVVEEPIHEEEPTVSEASAVDISPAEVPPSVVEVQTTIEELPVEASSVEAPAPVITEMQTAVEELQKIQEPERIEEPAEEPEPEPDFVCINVMERIVKEKIIYYMRQFDCCTCDHCIADTVALTLNGLAPKYIVAPPAAEAALISFYTNKFISDVTVEATKACIVVKENPRH